MGTDGQTDAKLRVFISYSRTDLSFAEKLLEALSSAGFAAYIDRTDIAPGEPWQERISNLIGAADTVLFIVSPASVASTICGWEVQEAERLAKRILPILWRAVPDAAVPERLRRLNYTDLSEATDFATGMRRLTAALLADVGWIREHTRLGELATRWKQRNRAEDAALRGGDLEEAENWIAGRPASAPEVSENQRAFIRESRAAEQARSRQERGQIVRMRRLQRRFGAALVGAALVLTAGGAATILQSHKAAESRILALAQRAHEAFQAEYYDRAIRYAVAAMPPPGAFPWDRPAGPVAIAEAELAKAAVKTRLVKEEPPATDAHGDVAAAMQPVDVRKTPAASDPAIAALVSAVTPEYNTVWRITADDAKSRMLVLKLSDERPGQAEAMACEQMEIAGAECEPTPSRGTVDLYDVASRELIRLPGFEYVDFLDAAISPKGDGIVFANESRIFFRPFSGSRDTILAEGAVANDGSLVFSATGDLLAASLRDNSVLVWRDGYYRPPIRLVGHRAAVTGIGFVGDKGVVTRDAANVSRYWTLESPEWDTSEYNPAPAPAWPLEHDGRKLEVRGNVIVLLDAATGQELLSEDREAAPLAAGFAESGRAIAVREQGVDWQVVNEDPDCVTLCSEPVPYEAERLFEIPDAALLHGEALVDSVCNGKLDGVAFFTEDERQDPLLVGIDGSVCEERDGPLSAAYYRRWIAAKLALE